MTLKGICSRTARLSQIMTKLKKLTLSKVNNIIVGNLNINSLLRSSSITKNINILVLTETKLDETFPPSRFLIDEFSKPFRLDRKRSDGGIWIFVMTFHLNF